MKVLVVGCTHAGTAAILTTRNHFPEAEITVYERNDNISFLSCGIALYVGGVIKDPKGLFYCSPGKLQELNVKTQMKHNVLEVNLEKKIAIVADLVTGKEFEDSFDKLIITCGSWPIVPPIPGIDSEGILLSKNFLHSEAIIEASRTAKKVVVVGAGYIGVELVEAFIDEGKEVTLVDAETRIMSKYLDKEFTDVAEASFKDHGAKLALGEKVVRFEEVNGKVSKVVTDQGSYEADLVILSVGFRPNTEMFKGQLAMLPNGAIQVDSYMRTSHSDVVAAGDCCSVMYNPTGEISYIPLATNAVRMGTLAGINLVENRIAHPGTQGTSGIKVFENNIASTGLTEEEARRKGINVDSVTIVDNYRPEFMPTFEAVTLKVIYHAENKQILGAQIHSKADLTQSINTLSVCIQNKMTVTDLAFIDFFFQPHFNKPWNFLNTAGLQAIK